MSTASGLNRTGTRPSAVFSQISSPDFQPYSRAHSSPSTRSTQIPSTAFCTVSTTWSGTPSSASNECDAPRMGSLAIARASASVGSRLIFRYVS